MAAKDRTLISSGGNKPPAKQALGKGWGLIPPTCSTPPRPWVNLFQIRDRYQHGDKKKQRPVMVTK
jgi:hypothetical protein